MILALVLIRKTPKGESPQLTRNRVIEHLEEEVRVLEERLRVEKGQNAALRESNGRRYEEVTGDNPL